MFYLRKIKITALASSVLAIVFSLAITLPPALASAQAYGEGTYGECPYGQSCASTSSPSSNTNPTSTQQTDTTSSAIILNDYEEYFVETGKQLSLTKSQVIYFDVETNGVLVRHSVTVKEILEDRVVLVIASTPRDVTIYINETKRFDVTDDKVDDIEITLKGIADGRADLVFRALKKPAVAAPDVSAAKSSWWGFLVSLLLIASGLSLFWWLIKRRRRQDDQ